MSEICLWKTGRYCIVHCAGEDSSARIGEDRIKKCQRRVSPFTPEKTMEEVSAGFVLLFLVSMNQGILKRIMKIWKMIQLLSPLPSPMIHWKVQSCQMKTIFKVINMLTIFTLCLLVFVIWVFCYIVPIIIHLYKPSLFFCHLLKKALLCFITASEPDDEDFVLCELFKPPKDASYEICRICKWLMVFPCLGFLLLYY